MTGFKEINLSVLLEEIGEERTQSVLADYSCPRNADIEDFIRKKAVLFSRQGIARTHLVFASYKYFKSKQPRSGEPPAFLMGGDQLLSM